MDVLSRGIATIFGTQNYDEVVTTADNDEEEKEEEEESQQSEGPNEVQSIGVESIADEVVPLQNLAHDPGSESNQSGENTSINHFNRFLTHQHLPLIGEWSNLTEAELKELYNQDLIGKFATYLIQVAKIPKRSSTAGYLSHVKTALARQYPEVTARTFNESWYKSLRGKVKGVYIQQALATGGKMSDSAPRIRVCDILIMATILFQQNNYKSNHNRALLIYLWQLLGRVMELTLSKHSDVSYSSRSITIGMLIRRIKTGGDEQVLNIFMHRNKFLMCPIHSLAVMYALSGCVTDKIFYLLPTKEPSAYVNNLLRQLEDVYLEELEGASRPHPDDDGLKAGTSSHSFRRGGATAANEHHHINTNEIVQRGGWTLDGLNTVFSYLEVSDKLDHKMGRVLSDWENAFEGGKCPSLLSIPEGEREEFKTFSFKVIKTMKISESERCVLVCMLLHYHDEVKEAYPDHDIVLHVVKCIGSTQRMKDKVNRWVGYIHESFRAMNAAYILGGDGTAESRSMYEVSHRMDAVLNVNTDNMISMRQELASANARMGRMEDMILRILNGNRNITGHQLVDQEPPVDGIGGNNLNDDYLVQHDMQRNGMDFPPLFTMDTSKLSIETIFTRWYLEGCYELHRMIPPSRQFKDMRGRVSQFQKILFWMKLFLDDGTVIPSYAVDEIERVRIIEALAALATQRIFQFLEENKLHLDAVTNVRESTCEQGKKRRKPCTPYFTPVFKKLNKCDAAKFPVNVGVVDENI